LVAPQSQTLADLTGSVSIADIGTGNQGYRQRIQIQGQILKMEVLTVAVVIGCTIMFHVINNTREKRNKKSTLHTIKNKTETVNARRCKAQ